MSSNRCHTKMQRLMTTYIFINFIQLFPLKKSWDKTPPIKHTELSLEQPRQVSLPQACYFLTISKLLKPLHPSGSR